MKDAMDWPKVSELLQQRILNSKVYSTQSILMVGMKPPEEQPCFFSSQMIRSLKSLPFFLFSVPEAISQVVEEGKKQEELLRQTEIEETVLKFFKDFKERLQSFLDKLIEQTTQSLLQAFKTSGNIVSFFHELLDGSLNSNEKMLKELEGVIRQMALRTTEDDWKIDQVKSFLNMAQFKIDFIAKNFEDGLKLVFQKVSKEEDNVTPFPLLKSLRLEATAPNNFGSDSIVYGHGLDCSASKKTYYSLSNAGQLVSRDIETDKELFRVKIQNGSHVCDSLALSPDSKTIGIALRTSKTVLFFDSEDGKLLHEIPNAHLSTSNSSIWLNNDSFCVGYKDGTIKEFSLSSGKCVSITKAIGVGVVSALEVNDPSSLLGIDNFNSVYCFDIKESSVRWKVTNWHEGADTNQWKYGLKKSFDNRKLATSGDSDSLVKVMELKTQSLIWESSIGTRAWGISWVPGDKYLLVMGETAPYKVAALSGESGKLLCEFTSGFDTYLYSMAVHFEAKSVLVGDHLGRVHKLKIEE